MVNLLAFITEPDSLKLLDLVNLFGDQIAAMNTHWNFLAVVALGVLGYVYKDETMRGDWRTKLALSIGFVIFAIANQSALRQTFEIAHELASLIKARSESVPEFGSLAQVHYVSSTARLHFFHTLVIVAVLAGVWMPNLVKWRSGKTSKPQAGGS